jgi:hypothetical protein
VRRTEQACPFCGVSLALDAAPMRVVGERLGRAAIFSLGAAAITSVAGCGARSSLPEPAAFAAVDAGPHLPDAGQPPLLLDDGGAPSTHYGGPPVIQEDGGIDADLGCCSADYGGPPGP